MLALKTLVRKSRRPQKCYRFPLLDRLIYGHIIPPYQKAVFGTYGNDSRSLFTGIQPQFSPGCPSDLTANKVVLRPRNPGTTRGCRNTHRGITL